MPVDKFGRMSDTKTRDTGVLLTYINNNYIRSDGGTPVSGSIDMRGNTLYNVSNPVNPQDVATMLYVDDVGKKVKESLSQERKHLIVVHAKYWSPLKKGEYPFKFSGDNFETCEENIEKYNGLKGSTTGFSMPHSGRIKKVMAECLGFIDLNDLFEKITEGLVGDDFEEAKKGFEELKKEPTKFYTDDRYRKSFFKIIKFEKNLNEEDYPQPYYNPPKTISSILIDKFKGVRVGFSVDKIKVGGIFRIINQDDRTLLEGDVINIEIGELNKPDNNIFIERFSCNITFLIELDPL